MKFGDLDGGIFGRNLRQWGIFLYVIIAGR